MSADRNNCPLGLCDGSGFLIDEATNTASDCRCRSGLIAAARTRSLEGRLPRRYEGVSFDRPPVTEIERVAPAAVTAVRRYVRQIDRNLDAGKGLWLVGDVGTGKTTLAMIISRAAIDAGRSVAIYSLPRLLNLIRDEIGTDNSLLDLLDRLSSVELLHIDDLGAQHTTPWRLEQLYSIVDARYQAGRAILATTNLLPPALSEQLGQRVLTSDEGRARTVVTDDASEVVGKRIVSRLVDMCGDPLTLYGADKRSEFRVPAQTS
jgi:DNA replication protein DnaC